MVLVRSFSPPESPIRLEQRNITVKLDKKYIGTGTLFISERTLSWQKNGTVGFSMEYYNISVHAVSRDLTVCDRHCLYLLTDPRLDLSDEPPYPLQEDESDPESGPDISELLLIPQDPSTLESMYEAIKICQELNPDRPDDEDDLYEDAEEGGENENVYIEAEGFDAEVNNLAQRLEGNSVNIQYNCNGNEDEDFEDAD